MAKIQVIDRDSVERSMQARPGLKVMEILRGLDDGVAAICRDLCSCATCHVHVDRDWATKLPPQSEELELLRELSDYRPDESRLSCQVDFTETLDEIRLTVAPDS